MTPTATDRMLGLVIMSGFMMLVTAIPLGMSLSLAALYNLASDWQWALIQGAVMTIATALVGGVFTGAGAASSASMNFATCCAS